MFLVRDQPKRLEGYDDLDPRERADFTFRILKKVTTLLDDISEVNAVLRTIPFKSQKKVFKEEHIDLIFDLLERILIGLDYAPIVKDQDGNPHRFKGIPVTPKGGGIAGSYQKITPASTEEIARSEHLQDRLKRLEVFITPRVTTADFRPRPYFEGLVEDAEKEGLEPFFVGPPGKRFSDPKPLLEDRIREAWELHGIEPPRGYEHLKKPRDKSSTEE